MTPTVTAALTGAAAGAAPSGTSFSCPNRMGVTEAAMSMMTVPATVGVMMRRSHASRAAKPNWNSDETQMSVAIKAAPPACRALTHTAMKAAEVPISSG